jgi:uncharacterized protein
MKARQEEQNTKGRALAVVAKAPLRGQVKTRLGPLLSLAQAADLYECLLRDIVSKMNGYDGSQFWLAFAPGGEDYFRRTFPNERLLAQRGQDLGERLHHIFMDLFRVGYDAVIVADSDSPTVPLSVIERAYEELGEKGCDLVLGPCDDGGYYLVGLKHPTQGIFRDIPWSTARVLECTLDRARELELRAALLPRAYDIDVPEDLQRLWTDLVACQQLRELAPKTFAYMKNLYGLQACCDGHEAGKSR